MEINQHSDKTSTTHITVKQNIKHIHVITAANQAYPVQSATHIGISSNRLRACNSYRVGQGKGHGVIRHGRRLATAKRGAAVVRGAA
jgi:hypothetical protein